MDAQIMSKGSLAIILSKLKGFALPKVRLEQYTTDSQTAADILWKAQQLGDIQGKTIADLGAGTGILGIGALILGAKQVFFIESEKEALEIAKENYAEVRHYANGEAVFVCDGIENFNQTADTVIQNPPFGTRQKGADTHFLQHAFKIAPIVYSFHKTSTHTHIKKVSEQAEMTITHTFPYQLPIKATLTQHKHKIHRIDVTIYRFQKRLR